MPGLRRQLFEQFPLLAFAVFYTFVSSLILVLNGFPAPAFVAERLATYAIYLGVSVPALLAMQFFKIAVYDRPDRPLHALIRSALSIFTSGRCIAGFSLIAITNSFFFSFLVMKRAIPWFNPFSWDATFDQWDRFIHLGFRPWEVLQPVIGYGVISKFIDFNYYLWAITLCMYFLHFAFFEPSNQLRNRGILAYMLVWTMGGTLLATVFSSAGPCYFGYLGLGYDPYVGLMQYLRSIERAYSLITPEGQLWLWQSNLNQQANIVVKGISAMPSMHNAQVFLLVLAVWNKGLLIRSLAVAHCFLIFIGSVHLGWHYAVDGYFGFAIAAVCWLAADRLAHMWENRWGMSGRTVEA